MQDLAHLPIRRGPAEAVVSIRQQLPEAHCARVIHGVAERRLAQRTRIRWKEKRRCRLVVPDMRAVAEAAAARVVHALKAVELAIRGAEAGGGCERRQVRAGRLLHRRGQSAFAQCIRKEAGALFQRFEMLRCIVRGRPRISKRVA